VKRRALPLVVLATALGLVTLVAAWALPGPAAPVPEVYSPSPTVVVALDAGAVPLSDGTSSEPGDEPGTEGGASAAAPEPGDEAGTEGGASAAASEPGVVGDEGGVQPDESEPPIGEETEAAAAAAPDEGAVSSQEWTGTYLVKEGDTLYAIAHGLGVSVERLMRENAITDPTGLQIGRDLRVP
jgi:LysM repeat protein